MDWFKKHYDNLIIIAMLFSGFLWMNGKFNDIENRLSKIETVLIIKGLCPPDVLGVKKGE
jgi:hypothetical protein